MSFSAIQRAYGEHGVATFPLGADKTPAVKGYQRVGANGSSQLAIKFADATSAGFCAGRRNRLTVIDIDSTDDRLVDEIQNRFGITPLHVVTPSGGRHLYYRHNKELRRIRPPELGNVDILGAGNVVCAFSKTPKGRYEIERGTLADLGRLPPLRAAVAPPATPEKVPIGRRNNTMFRWALRVAPQCADFDTLLAELREINMDCLPPKSDNEVVRIARQAWNYETSGNNWVGRKARASMDRDEVLAFGRHTNALALHLLLRQSHPAVGKVFAIDQVETAVLLGWNRKTLSAAIDVLIAMKHLRRVKRGLGRRWEGKHLVGDPHLYKLTTMSQTGHNIIRHPPPREIHPLGAGSAKGSQLPNTAALNAGEAA